MTTRKFIFLAVFIPIAAFGQNKNCNVYIKESPMAPCNLAPYKKLYDTLFAKAPTGCNFYFYDTTANGTWKIYTADTTTLLKIIDIKSGRLHGTEINFYNNGQIASIENSVSGQVVTFYPDGKKRMDGYLKTVVKREKHYKHIDSSLIFTGTETWFWDNGNLAYRAITVYSNGCSTKEEYWDRDGGVIGRQKFNKLWYDCK